MRPLVAPSKVQLNSYLRLRMRGSTFIWSVLLNRTVSPWIVGLALSLAVEARAQAPAPTPLSVLGQVESVDAAARTLKLKLEDGTSLTVGLAEKGTVMKVAPGEKSLQNAQTIA